MTIPRMTYQEEADFFASAPHFESVARCSVEIAGKLAAVHESRLALWIRPRPRWCPSRLWRWMIRAVLVRADTPTYQLSWSHPTP